MAKTFRCKVVTPTAALIDEDVTYASVPAWDGLFGVLPGRAPILARLGVGELKLTPADAASGAEKSFVVEGGFVQMAENTLTVLAEKAAPAESLSVSVAEAEVKSLEARRIPEGPEHHAQAERLKRELDGAKARLKAARTKR